MLNFITFSKELAVPPKVGEEKITFVFLCYQEINQGQLMLHDNNQMILKII